MSIIGGNRRWKGKVVVSVFELFGLLVSKNKSSVEEALKNNNIEINHEQAQIMIVSLDNCGSVPMSTFTENKMIYREKTKVSKHVKKLIDLGYVIREDDEDDRRRKIIKLTEYGQGVAKCVKSTIEQHYINVNDGFSADELKHFHKMLFRLEEKVA